MRAHLAEFGIVAPVGRNGVEQLLDVIADASDQRLPEIARACVLALGAQLRRLKVQILNLDRQIIAWHRSNEASKRLDEIPGVGPALATALVASVADPKAFRCGRNFSAWIGLVPKQHSSGGKDKLGSISQQGDRYLRSLFTAGALAVIAGLVASLARPGGNVTGLSNQTADIGGKRVELLRELVGQVRRLAVMVKSDNESAASEMRQVKAAASMVGIEVVPLEIRHGEDIAPAFDTLKGRADALYVVIDSLVTTQANRINTLALAARLPTMHGARELAV